MDNDWEYAVSSGLIEELLSYHEGQIREAHDDNASHVNGLEDDEQEEVGVVPHADAVVDPLTVMVEPLDALVTDVAVPGVSGADDFTRWAQHIRFKLFDESQERDRRATLHEAGLHIDSDREENEGGGEEDRQNREPSVCKDVGENEEKHQQEGASDH